MDSMIKPDYKIRDQLLQIMIDNNGSDMYITTDSYPIIKILGELIRIDDGIDVLKSKDTKEFAESIITQAQHKKLLENKNLDSSISFNDRRFRINVSFQSENYMVVLRMLGMIIPSVESLGLSEIYKDVTKKGQGLILITGPTGSGKTTTLASMIDYINNNYNKHIVCIEEPIEYIHKHKMSIIEQKEIGIDIDNYEQALAGAMRQDSDIIMFGEIRSKSDMEMALTLAETGHLVMSTLHTRSAYQTITRIIDSFPSESKDQIRLQLSDSLLAIFSQRLLKTSDGTGLILAKEILVKNSAIANLIRENDLHQIPSIMQVGIREGMQLLETDISRYIDSGYISEEEGMKYANNPKILKGLE